MINNFTFTAPAGLDYSNKVAVIKAIRSLTAFGLKEAKDTSEVYGQQILPINIISYAFLDVDAKDQYIEEQFRIMRAEGCEVGESIHKLLRSLRELASNALEQGEDELANEILQLVLAEKLRRKQ